MMPSLRQTRLKHNLQLRARIIQAIREFFLINGFLEVETPCRIPAPAPEHHIDAEPSGAWFLHTSPELCMKRLLASGHTKIFQICKCFRQAERGSRHLPEFSMLEWYEAGIDYLDMMDQVEQLVCFMAQKIGRADELSYRGKRIDLKRPWPRMSVSQAFTEYAPISLEKALSENRFDALMVDCVEPNLDQTKPLFIYDYPASLGALARLKPDNPAVAERVELFMGGLEICNAFSELTDPVEQRKRFAAEQHQRSKAGKCNYPMPEKFLGSLEFMPESAGNALGVDRLVMLFTDAGYIDDVVAFTPEEF